MKRSELDLIHRAVDGDLAGGEAQRLADLLSGSPEAREEHASLGALRALAGTSAPDSFGPYFADRVMRRRKAAPARRVRTGFFGIPWPVATGALTVLLLAAIGLALWSQPQSVLVPYGQTETLTLPDGSRVELGGGARLTYGRGYGRGERRVLLEGEGFFDVVRQAEPFIVETFTALIEVRGTTFNVRAWPEDPDGETTVTLATGRVAVASRLAPAEPVVLTPGQTTVVSADSTRPAAPRALPLDRALAWRTGGLAFMDQSLGTVFNALERRFDLRIEAAPGVEDRAFTYLNPTPASADAVLSDLCQTLGLRYQRTADGYRVSP